LELRRIVNTPTKGWWTGAYPHTAHWLGLIRFLSDAGLAFDANSVENQIRRLH
jgi:hypothetical protein